MPMESAQAVANLTIPILSSYGCAILYISDDVKELTQNSTRSYLPKKNHVLALNVVGPIPSLITPRLKIFHLFTSKIKVKECVNIAEIRSMSTIKIETGEKVKISFYNLDQAKPEIHSFTIGEPYELDVDIAFYESGSVTFIVNNELTCHYNGKYHRPAILDKYWRYGNEIKIRISLVYKYARSFEQTISTIFTNQEYSAKENHWKEIKGDIISCTKVNYSDGPFFRMQIKHVVTKIESLGTENCQYNADSFTGL